VSIAATIFSARIRILNRLPIGHRFLVVSPI
jgi:hypothetical protein